MVKKRFLPENNYRAFWYGAGKTLRMKIDDAKPMTELDFPEFYDVKLTDRCLGACPWCYMSSTPEGEHCERAVEKLQTFFGSLSTNQRPFQVALGGGEPTSHPEFLEILQALGELGIVPNFTTNGMNCSEEFVALVRPLVGGVALSAHEHLERYWTAAAQLYLKSGIPLNLHLIISDERSIDRFLEIFKQWQESVEFFVLLPYVAQGRAEKQEQIAWDYLLKKLPKSKKIAYGAGFYQRLRESKLPLSLYEPESMSKFLDLSSMRVYRSSFALS